MSTADLTGPEGGEEELNILFFGNSYTMGSGGVPYLAAKIAGAAGKPLPNVNMRALGGKTLEWHLGNSLTAIGEPSDFAPSEGFRWDVLVMQEYSTRPTTSPRQGDPGRFVRDAAALYSHVAEHSPGVAPVLFQTWARSPKHEVYPEQFADPAAMQAQLRTNYERARLAVDEAAGAPVARVAPVGDAWEVLNWEGLHGPDEHHANDRGSLLAALVIYGTIYAETVSGIDLSGLASSLEIPSAQTAALPATADRVLSVDTGAQR